MFDLKMVYKLGLIQLNSYMISKPQTLSDNLDISWIHKDAVCWVYFPDEEYGPIFTKGVVKGIVPLSFNKGNSKVMGILQTGTQFETKAINLEKRRMSNLLERDLINLQIINAPEVLSQLSRKLNDKIIHTYLWNSLIIVNPFKLIPALYEEQSHRYYYEHVYEKAEPLPNIEPHVYAYVCEIMNKLRQSANTQMLCISGESGSGKTQTNKQCLKMVSYICERSGKNKPPSQDVTIEKKILNCNGILESFGNAKTLKNDNSSRFGKLVTEKVNKDKMEIISCQIKVFFLQKSRIIHQSFNERNFHVFYQLLKFCPTALKEELKLIHRNYHMRVSDFVFLKNTEHSETTTINDEEMWEDLNSSFKILNFSPEVVRQIWMIIVGILYIGNLSFDDSTLNDIDPCEIKDEELVTIIAGLIGLSEKQLTQVLIFHKKILLEDVILAPMTESQCIDSSRTLAKALYENLFLWIVEELNRKINFSQKAEADMRMIKMLDIYGFEVFEKNSFEQLCVNYTNERIHQVYLDQVFKHQKNVLKKQGLQSSIPKLNFTDNIKIIELIDTSSKSIYNLLDQNCTLNSKDDEYLASVKKNCEGHEHFPPSNNVTTRKAFIIRHTPCQIQYLVEGFRSKNKDFLKLDIAEKLSTSRSHILKLKFKEEYERLKAQANKKFLGLKIRKEVSSLISEISLNSDIHFIRCIKPNEDKEPFKFVERVSYNQIKYLGILDTVQMRKNCYHVRLPYTKFYQKYGILDGDIDRMLKVQANSYTNEECKVFTKSFFEKNFKTQQLQYLFGNERLFMKMSTQNFLDTVFKNKMSKVTISSTLIKALGRHATERNERSNYMVRVRNIQGAIRSYLKVAQELKYKKAVQVIERQWIKRCETYFRRKRRPSLMVLQKYLKTNISKYYVKRKEKSITLGKKRLKALAKGHKTANTYDNFKAIKTDLLTHTYELIWKKMTTIYVKNTSIYFKSFAVKATNKKNVEVAYGKSIMRETDKYINTINKSFHTFLRARRMQSLLKIVLKMQSLYRMNRIRKLFQNMKEKTIKIQRAWRDYKYNKTQSTRFNEAYFEECKTWQKQWESLLHRSLSKNILAYHEGAEKVLSEFEKVKKDKIILFYYLLDVDVLCSNPALADWHLKYLSMFEEGIYKSNPIQYLDISESKTVIASTNKVYSWGNFRVDNMPGVEEHPLNSAKISKVSVTDDCIRIGLMNKDEIIIGDENSEKNRDWSTLKDNFLLLNGVVLTVNDISFTKLNISEKVSEISCGMGHFICRTMLKKVYTWGQNAMGQLGHGNFHNNKNTTPRLVEYFTKKRIPVAQVGATAHGSVVMDSNSKIYWFGSNGSIKCQPLPQECILSNKSNFLPNSQKYSVIRIIPKWSKSVSLIGITVACHDNIFKNQISLRKKIFQSLIQKWNEDIHTINPPHNQSISNHFQERHMPLPVFSDAPKLKQKNAREKLLNDIGLIEEAERELLRTRKHKK